MSLSRLFYYNLNISNGSIIATHNSNTIGNIFTTAGNIGIGTTAPQSNLDINGTTRISGNVTIGSNLVVNGPILQIPTGNISSRPITPPNGSIRYNTETQQFEGYGPGGAWGSLGGVIDISQTTKVLASASPNTTDGNLYFITTGTERMRINSSGNIGIGTTSPSFLLDVAGSARFTNNLIVPTGNITSRPLGQNGSIRYNTETQQFEGYGPGDAWGSLGGVIDIAQSTKILASASPNTTDGNLYFITTGTERMRINSSGNIGIGTTSPSVLLDVLGTSKLTNSIITNSTITNLILTTNSTISNIASTNIISSNITTTNLIATNFTASNFVANNVNYGISSAFSGSFSASNNVDIPTNITGFNFSNSNTRSFQASVTVSILRSSGGNLYQNFSMDGFQTDSGWSLYVSKLGDDTGLVFNITSEGQIQYRSTNITNFTSNTIRFSVLQISNTGSYSSVGGLTQGTLVIDSLQIVNTSNSILGTNPGSLNVLGGSTLSKSVNILTTENSVGLGSGGALTILGGTSISKDLFVGGSLNTNNLQITGNTNTFGPIITNNTYVEIGTTQSNYNLNVNGNINLSGDLYQQVIYNNLKIQILRNDGIDLDGNSDMVFDSLNNLYVCGYSTSTQANFFATNGNTIVASLGNLNSNFVSFVTKYDTNLNFLYNLKIDGTGSEFINNITTDQLNNLYINGYSFNTTQTNFYATNGTTIISTIGNLNTNGVGFLAKYNSSGSLVYSLRIDGTNNENHYSVKTDSNNNVYLSGSSNSPLINIYTTSGNTIASIGNLNTSGSFGYVIKYNSLGTYQYNLRIDGSNFDTIRSMLIDSNNNLYIGSHSNSTQANFYATDGNTIVATLGNLNSNYYSSYLTKYNSSGTFLYSLYLDGANVISSIISDTLNNIYITGYSSNNQIKFYSTDGNTIISTLSNSNTSGSFGYIAKYNSLGTYLYSLKIDGIGNTNYYTSITSDFDDNIYACGYSTSPLVNIYTTNGNTVIDTINNQVNTRSVGYIIKYNSLGTYQYSFKVDGSRDESFERILTDSNNNLYAIGNTYSTQANFYTTDGNIILATMGNYNLTNSGFIAKYSNKQTFPTLFTTNGNIGIGTSTPSTTLQISSINGSHLAINPNPGSFVSIEAFSTGNTSKLPLCFNPYGGNVGIGTTSPQQTLHVNGNVLINNGNLRVSGRVEVVNRRPLLISAGGNYYSLTTTPQTIASLYGPYAYASEQNPVPNGATRQYRIYAVYSDDIQNGISWILRITNGTNSVDYTMDPTYGGATSSRDFISAYSVNKITTHGSLQILGQAGQSPNPNSILIHYIELQTLDVYS